MDDLIAFCKRYRNPFVRLRLRGKFLSDLRFLREKLQCRADKERTISQALFSIGTTAKALLEPESAHGLWIAETLVGFYQLEQYVEELRTVVWAEPIETYRRLHDITAKLAGCFKLWRLATVRGITEEHLGQMEELLLLSFLLYDRFFIHYRLSSAYIAVGNVRRMGELASPWRLFAALQLDR